MTPTILMSLALLACSGPDSSDGKLDADGDGFSADVDCDDADPRVHPGAIDLWNDALDADCDRDDQTYAFEDLHALLTQSGSEEGSLQVVESCDGNVDGVSDLLIATTGEQDGSRLLLFAGPLSPGPLSLTDAYASFARHGFDGACGDFDGDGRPDVLTLSPQEDGVPGGLAVYVQPPEGFSGDYTPDQALWFELPEVSSGTTYSTADFASFDTDARLDVQITQNVDRSLIETADTGWDRELWRLSGGTPAGPVAEVAAPFLGDDGRAPERLRSHVDLDGDGRDEVFSCEGNGDCVVLQGYPFDGSDSTPHVMGYVSRSRVARPSNYIGGDFDGDGHHDDVAGAGIGSLVVYTDVWEALTTHGSVGPRPGISIPVGLVYPKNVGDIDGDGADDIGYWASTSSGPERRVISGALANRGTDIDAMTLLRVQSDDTLFGSFAGGDFDADGRGDVAIGGHFHSGADGYVGVYLSSVAPIPQPIVSEPPVEGPLPDSCDFSEIDGTWSGMVDPLASQELQLVASAPAGETIGANVLAAPSLDITVEFTVECVPTADGTYRVFNRLVDWPHPNGIEGWYDLVPQADGSLSVLNALEPGGEVDGQHFIDRVEP